MNSTEILLLFGTAIGMTIDEQEEFVEGMSNKVPEGDTPIESVRILTKGMDTTTLYTGVLLYMWLQSTYGDRGEDDE